MPDFLAARLEHAFDIRVDFGADRMLSQLMSGGWRHGYTPPHGGTITGPRLNGIVVPHSGADYALLRDDGVLELATHYMLQADDGTMIDIQGTGYLVQNGTEVNDQGLAQPQYFKFTPKFRVEHGPHDWLMRSVFVAAGERRRDPDHSLFRYYVVV